MIGKKEWDEIREYMTIKLFKESAIQPVSINTDTAALLIVDMQYGDAHSDYGLGAIAREQDHFGEYEWYFSEMPRIIRNQQQLIRACRDKGIEVVYSKISSLTKNGRDTGYSYTRTTHSVTPVDSKEAQILEELRPDEDDIVIMKTSDSMFNSQYNLDRILRNISIQLLMVCGVVTNGCVESTVRDATDLGYDVITVGDACLAVNEFQHQIALMEQAIYCSRIKQTQEILKELEAAPRAKSKSKIQYSDLSLPKSSQKRKLA